MTTDPRSGVTVLAASDCWSVLRTAQVGRLATAVANEVDIFPINFLVDHATIVFRTAEGSKLLEMVINPVVAFEADGYDSEAERAWSVVVKGRAHEISGIDDLLETASFPLFPWHFGPKHRFVRIVPQAVSGRQFHVVDSAAWRTSFTDGPRAPRE